MRAMPIWLKQKLFLPREIDKGLNNEYEGPIYFNYHHQSHAASAFFPSPFEEAAVITFDGVGEWATTTWGTAKGNTITLKGEISFPHSLGLLYSAFTYYCGFKVNSGEYKLMGLAPYGTPKYADIIYDNIIDLKEDGSFWLDQSYFNYSVGLTMTSEKFHRLLGGVPRKPDAEITQRDMDIAASIQLVTEEIMLRITRYVHKETGLDNLCLAGGVALNCVGNGKILREGPFKNIWIQPAAGDAGGALGAALYTYHQIMGHKRSTQSNDAQQGSLLGPALDDTAIAKHLDSVAASYKHYDSEDDLCDTLATLLDQGNIVGHCEGRMEFGPRALGNRSILGDPRNPEMQETINLKIKFRESFRPFAPVTLKEKVQEYFDIQVESPYMLFVAPVSSNTHLPNADHTDNTVGLEKIKLQRSTVPAITHVDYTARIQTVTRDKNPRIHKLLSTFEAKTGCPVLINTSFNIRGEPIVCTPEEAYRSFMLTDMDVLVMNRFICIKKDQPEMVGAEEYKNSFTLD